MASKDYNEVVLLLRKAQGFSAIQPATAIALFERALQMAPDHPEAVEALAKLAEAYQSLKRFNECAFLLESCVEIEPRNLPHHIRLCAYRLTRAQYHKAAQSLQRFIEMGGTPEHLEHQMPEHQHPKSVNRSLRALCESILKVGLTDLPHFKTMGEIVAFEEQLRISAQPELAASVVTLQGVDPDLLDRLQRAGVGTLARLSGTNVSDLLGLEFSAQEAETLLDALNSQVYVANSQGGNSQ